MLVCRLDPWTTWIIKYVKKKRFTLESGFKNTQLSDLMGIGKSHLYLKCTLQHSWLKAIHANLRRKAILWKILGGSENWEGGREAGLEAKEAGCLKYPFLRTTCQEAGTETHPQPCNVSCSKAALGSWKPQAPQRICKLTLSFVPLAGCSKFPTEPLLPQAEVTGPAVGEKRSEKH